jgi:hypothetical protein
LSNSIKIIIKKAKKRNQVSLILPQNKKKIAQYKNQVLEKNYNSRQIIFD